MRILFFFFFSFIFRQFYSFRVASGKGFIFFGGGKKKKDFSTFVFDNLIFKSIGFLCNFCVKKKIKKERRRMIRGSSDLHILDLVRCL